MAEQTRRAVEVGLADERTLVFHPDASGSAQPVSSDYDTEMPGGFGPGSVVLPRGELARQDIGLFSSIRIFGADDDATYYEGRVTGISTSGAQVALELEGWAKHLEDDKTRRYLFVDRDLTQWTGPSITRKIVMASGNFSTYDASVTNDPATGASPSLETTFEDKWAATSLPSAEGLYDAGPGMSIGSIYYAWEKNRWVIDIDTSWVWAVQLGTDDGLVAVDGTGNLRAAGPGSGTLVATTPDRRYAAVQHSYVAAPSGFSGTIDGTLRSIYWTCLAVYGDHGLPKQGDGDFLNAPGLLASDCMVHALKDAPLLRYTTGPYGSIEPTSFGIPHLVLDSPGSALDAINAINVFGGAGRVLNDWGVYEDRTFFCRTPGTYGRTWRVRLDETAESSDSGPDSQRALNGVVVVYDDGTGTQKSVGPPGSQADVTLDFLVDADPANPANNDGARHWAVYDAGITSAIGAALVGQLVLYNASTFDWRGDVVVTDKARDSSGAVLPVELIRAGDHIVVEDDYDTAPRKVTGTGLSGRQVTASVGADPDQLDVLLARAGVVLLGRV